MSTQQDINAIGAQRLANTHDPSALMANTQTPFHPDQSSLITYLQHPQPNNNFVQQPTFNTNYMQQPMQNPKDISDPTTALDMTLELMSKAFQLNNITPTNDNQRSSSNPCYMQNVGHLVRQNAVQNQGTQNVGNRNRLSVVPGIANQHGNRNIQIALKEEAGIQLTQDEFDFMADASAYEEIERVNANCTLKDNLQQASTSGTQTDKAPVYDSNELAEVSSLEQSGGIVEQHPATPEETHALYDSLYNNLATEVEKVNSVNRKLRETNADLTTELARYKNQEKCFEISQEKYDKLERFVQNNSVVRYYQISQTSLNGRGERRRGSFENDGESLSGEAGRGRMERKGRELIGGVAMARWWGARRTNSEIRRAGGLRWSCMCSEVERHYEVDKTNDLSKPVTSNSVPSTHEPKVVNITKVIALGMLRMNPTMNSRVDMFVPNKYVKASVRTKPTTASQPRVITKNDSEKIEENHRSLQSSHYLDHTSSACNNIKLAIRNEKSKVICATWSKESLASPKTSTPRSCLMWLPTERLFDLKGKIIASSESESQSDCSKGDNACTSNPQEPISRRLLNSIFSMTVITRASKKRGVYASVRFTLKEENSSCFHFSRYDSHDINDRVGKSIRSFVRRIIQMEKIKLFQSLPLLLLLMHPGELFGNSGNTQCVLNDFSDTQNWRDLPRNTPLDRVEVLGMIKKRSKVRMGIMPTKTELALEQSQQGVSYEVSVSIEGVEE
ncbi:hypothetical protein Tco_1475007 [Tanacetum coccineum]